MTDPTDHNATITLRRGLSRAGFVALVFLASLVVLCCLCGWCAAEIPRDVARDRCDLAEVNHYHDLEGRLIFDQLIVWQWDSDGACFRCSAWRLIKSPHQLPRRDYARGGYVVTWMDGEILRELRAAAVEESWTQHDPELCDRDFWPKEMRRELSPPPTVRRAKP